jgi:hypothetical protein
MEAIANPLVTSLAELARHCWRGAHWRKSPKGPVCVKEALTFPHLVAHLGRGPAVGLAPIVPGTNVTRLALLDMDSHKGEVAWERMARTAGVVMAQMRARGLAPIPFRSSGGKGIHLICLWDEPQDARSVRVALAQCLQTCGLINGTKGVRAGEVEIFPKQESVPEDGFGSMFILPLHGESLPLEPTTLQLMPVDFAGEMTWPKSNAVPVLPTPAVEPSGLPPSLSVEFDELRSALAAIPNEGEQALDYDAWRNVIFGIHHATGGSSEGLALAQEFSARSTKHSPEFLEERVWPYIRQERGGKVVTSRTIFDLARKHSWIEPVANDFEELPPEQSAPCPAPAGRPVGEPSDATVAAPVGNRFKVVPAHEFAAGEPPAWIVEGVLPEAELALIIGQSTAGKSFVALDLLFAIARGVPWRGRPTNHAPVVYICAEGAGGFRKRVAAAAKHYGVDLEQLRVGVIADSPNLMLKDDIRDVLVQIKEFGRPAVIVVDTFAQATPGANENSGEDMGRALGHCKTIHKLTGALVVLVHHIGKDESKGARGWSGIKAAADAEISVTRNGDQRLATITKMKDGDDGVEMPFRLLVVPVGERAGVQVDSCVVEHLEASADRAKRREPSGRNMKAVWRLVNDLAELGAGAIPFETIYDAAVQKLQPPAPGEKDRRRATVKRALDDLAEARFVTLSDQGVAIPSA